MGGGADRSSPCCRALPRAIERLNPPLLLGRVVVAGARWEGARARRPAASIFFFFGPPLAAALLLIGFPSLCDPIMAPHWTMRSRLLTKGVQIQSRHAAVMCACRAGQRFGGKNVGSALMGRVGRVAQKKGNRGVCGCPAEGGGERRRHRGGGGTRCAGSRHTRHTHVQTQMREGGQPRDGVAANLGCCFVETGQGRPHQERGTNKAVFEW